MKVYDLLDLTSPDVVIGRHSVWLPEKCIKVPFQYGGMITKYTCPGESRTPVEETLPHELAIFRALAEKMMAPNIGDVVYFKEMVSEYDGAWRSDPMGAYGFEMEDVSKGGKGLFDIRQIRVLPIKGSDGAWNDIRKPGNVINGYLIDVRRTAWDMMKWQGTLPKIRRYQEDLEALEERIQRDCQFPKGEREEPYQDVWLRGKLIKGAREVQKRAEKLGFDAASGESILDIGCQTGGMLQLGEGRLAGIDVDDDYISCAKDIARANEQNICFRKLDVTKQFNELIEWVPKFFKGPPDHLLLLSMEKHIGEALLWRLVDEIGARHTYLETNAMKPGIYRLRGAVEARGGKYLGDSEDRSTRRLYRIDRDLPSRPKKMECRVCLGRGFYVERAIRTHCERCEGTGSI